MPKLRKVDGAWRSVAARYRKVAGQWRKVVDSYRKVDGIWVNIFSSMYVQMFVNNPNPDIFDVGISYDINTNAYYAYIHAKERAEDLVEVGIRIGNLPQNSKVQFKIATYDGIAEFSTVRITSGGAFVSNYSFDGTGYTRTYTNISNDLVISLHMQGNNFGDGKKNFKLSSLSINDVLLPAT